MLHSGDVSLSLLLIDPHTLVRQALSCLLQTHGIEVVGEAEDSATALQLVEQCHPAIVLTEVSVAPTDGFDLTKMILNAAPATRVIAVSGRSDCASVLKMVHAGAAGYVLKNDPFDHLTTACQTVADGQTYFSAKIAPFVETPVEHNGQVQVDPSQVLAGRELQVLRLLADGQTIKEAAATLQVSAKTVEPYRARVMSRLGLSNVTAMTRYAVRAGLIEL
jgi:DNA-binding NarL/FixJ family response regulator